MSTTPNYGLHLTDNDQEKFIDWRNAMNGPTDSNMIKIDGALSKKEETDNKTTVLTSESTDDEYPSAKCVYDFIHEAIIGAIEEAY